VATGLIVFEGDGNLRRHAGGYDLYRRLKEQREAEAAAAAVPAKKPAAAPARAPAAERPRKLTWKEQREMEGIEAAILEAEARKAELEARLADPALYARPTGEAARVTADFQAATREVDALYARWAELEEIAAASAP
jgi:ATP-binding cassette subfamily F protein uup